MKPAQDRPDPRLRYRRARRDIVRETGMEAGREWQMIVAAIAPNNEADWPFSRDMDAIGPALGDQLRDLCRPRQRHPQIAIARHRNGAKRVRRQEYDLMTEGVRRLRHHGQRP